MLKNLSPEEHIELVPDGIILLGYRGSIVHGTYLNPEHIEDSIDDKDIMGVCIRDPEYYFGLEDRRFEYPYWSRGTHEHKLREWDSVSYELRKFVGLLYQANPNVLSLLWLEPHHYILRYPEGDRLIENRHLFISKKIYYAFVGYAYGQMKRMTHGNARGYMGAKRKELLEKFGFDCKNASHLIRLLRMGIEFLREGELHVYRHDAPQLIEIKTGQWSLEQVQQEADHLFKRAEKAYDECKFPNEPDRDKVNALLVEILTEHFKVQLCQKTETI